MAVMCGGSDDEDLEYHPPTRDRVLAQLDDWRRRLDALYTDINAWLPAQKGYQSQVQDYLTDEAPMRHVGVSPQPVPELVVRRQGEPVLTFTPDACWIIGVLGRVMVSNGGNRRHKLVEVSFPPAERGWRLYRGDWPRPAVGQPPDARWRRGIPFDRQALLELVGPFNEGH